jgi:hypothetical protein
MTKIWPLLFLILFSCATPQPPVSSNVEKFVKNWSENFIDPANPEIESTYLKYLSRVERIYNNTGNAPLFNVYLDSVTNVYQVIAHRENVLPTMYQRDKRRGVTRLSQQEFISQDLRGLRERIFTEREQRIKNKLGEDTFSELRKNYTDFMKRMSPESFVFPL